MSNLGEVIYIQVLVGYFSVLCAFGFNISVTRMISGSLNFDYEKKIFWNTIYIKVLMVVFLCFPYVYICDFLELRLDYCMVLYVVLLSEAIFPIWYYQGIQKMKSITIVGVTCRIFVFLMVIFFVQDEKDIFFYVFMLSLIPLVVNFISLILLIYNKKMLMVKPDVGFMWMLIVHSLPLFYGTLSSVVKDRTNLLLVGALIGKTELVIYDFIIKCISVFSMVFVNLTNAQFPEISRSKSVDIFRKYFRLIVCSSVFVYVFGCVFVFYFSKDILSIVFGVITGSEELFIQCLILLLLIPLRAISYQIGLGVLVSNGFDREYAINLFYSVIFYVIACAILFVLGLLDYYVISLVLVVTVIFELFHRVVLCKRGGLITWLI